MAASWIILRTDRVRAGASLLALEAVPEDLDARIRWTANPARLVRFESEEQAMVALALLPEDPRWLYTVDRIGD